MSPLGPRAEIEITPRVSVGTVRQVLSTVRVFSVPGGKSGLVVVDRRVAEVGVLVAERGDQGDAVAPGEVDRPLRGHPMTVRCSSCSSGESAGLSRQL